MEPKSPESQEKLVTKPQEPIKQVVKPELTTKLEATKEPTEVKSAAEYIQGFLNVFTERTKGNLSQVTVSDAAKAGGLDPTQWEIIRAVVDSGASVPVIHPATGRGYEVLESEGSRAGVEYETAGGHSLANLGKKRLAVLTREGTIRGYQSECADVTKSLRSVRSLIKNRHAVLFGLGEYGDQHMIVNKDTGEVNWLEDDGVNYIQSLMVIPLRQSRPGARQDGRASR